jgi:hypothetical protein
MWLLWFGYEVSSKAHVLGFASQSGALLVGDWIISANFISGLIHRRVYTEWAVGSWDLLGGISHWEWSIGGYILSSALLCLSLLPGHCDVNFDAHTLLTIIFCLRMVQEQQSQGLKPLKPWSKINLSSLKLSFQIFVTALKISHSTCEIVTFCYITQSRNT